VYSLMAILSAVGTNVVEAISTGSSHMLSYESALWYMLLLSVHCVYTGLLWVYACIVAVVLVVLVLSLSAIDMAYEDDGAGYVVSQIFLSLFVTLCASYTAELYKRQRFVTAWQVRLHSCCWR
jgi:hypothetical protein